MKTELSEYKAIETNVRLIKGMLTSLVNLYSGVIPKNLYMPKVREVITLEELDMWKAVCSLSV